MKKKPKLIPPRNTPIPQSLYSCADDACAEERSWPAEDLYWIPGWGGWYCPLCVEDSSETPGVSLAVFLKRTD